MQILYKNLRFSKKILKIKKNIYIINSQFNELKIRFLKE